MYMPLQHNKKSCKCYIYVGNDQYIGVYDSKDGILWWLLVIGFAIILLIINFYVVHQNRIAEVEEVSDTLARFIEAAGSPSIPMFL